MRMSARSLLGDIDYEFESSLIRHGGAIGLSARRDLYLVFKELLHNVARHSGANKVDIRLARVGNVIELTVDDDGIGFAHAAAEDSGGDGLRNIRRRSGNMGGTFEVRSKIGVGTRATLSAPLTRTRNGPRV